MLTLNRYGNTGTTQYDLIDNLSLSYRGNQLIKEDDAGAVPTLGSYTSMDFKDTKEQEIEYAYDRNGNLVKDSNKGITDIQYNSLNLPRKVSFKTGHSTEYVYSASGQKLSVIHKSATQKKTDYVGNLIYENGSLKRILIDGGYIENGNYYFYLTDHLGNNRVVADATGNVIQTNHYYPFGASFAEGVQNTKQPYKYNGKELDQENGLNLYDYEARQMEPAIGRFTRMDPLAEKYYSISPYAYVANNPLKFVDPTGMYYIDKTKAVIYVIRGSVKLKVENLNFVTKGRINYLNSNPRYWNSGDIGFNTNVGKLSWQTINAMPSSEMVGATDSPYEDSYGRTDINNPRRKDGEIDQRYKNRSVATATPSSSARLGKGLLILDAINIAVDCGIQFGFHTDKKKVEKQTGILGFAIQDLNIALEQGIIPEGYQDLDNLSAILNFILQSENYTDDENVSTIGQRIIDEISKRREE